MRSSLITGAMAATMLLGIAASAVAADLAIKAPPPTPWVLDVHGFVDFTYANTRVTGGGLLLYPANSALFQQTTGIELDIYKDPGGFINSFSVFGGLWNELYTDPHDLQVGFRHWQEMDWWAGMKIGFAKYWTFSAQHVEFVFPWDGTAFNDIFSLSLDDSFLGWAITFNPYIQMFYNERGGSTVVLGKRSNTERYEVGVIPKYSFLKTYGVPLTLIAPTWVEFGPSEFWNRNDGTTNFCGALSNAPCSLSSLGYISTGLQAKYTLDAYIPKRLGTWYVKGGVQYYHITNDALLAAQTLAGTAVVATFSQAKEDVAVFNAGVGFSF